MDENTQIAVEVDGFTNTSEMEGKYLTFWTDNQLFGVPIADVVQIIKLQKITCVPDFPQYAKGIIDLRGSIIPLIDVRLRFGKEETEYNERTCVIVTSIYDHMVGLIVDEVNEVSNIDKENISTPPKMSATDNSNAFLTGIAKQNNFIVLLLDTEKIMSNETIEILTKTKTNKE